MKELKECDYFKTWLLFFLIATVGGGIVGGIIGAFLGGGLGVAGFSMSQVKIVCGIAGLIVGIPISYLTFRFVISKCLLPKLNDDDIPLPA